MFQSPNNILYSTKKSSIEIEIFIIIIQIFVKKKELGLSGLGDHGNIVKMLVTTENLSLYKQH